jgi:hypothetical protein
MAFVPDHQLDVFVSYAHVDDRPFLDAPGPERSAGWVGTLVRHLKNELAQKIGRDEAFAVWFDTHNLRGNDTLTVEIAMRLQLSATLLAILSPVPRRGAAIRRRHGHCVARPAVGRREGTARR